MNYHSKIFQSFRFTTSVRMTRFGICMAVFAGVTVLVLIPGVFFAAVFMPYPWHASCKIEWEIAESCTQVKQNLLDQIQAWEGDGNCGSVSDTCPGLPCGQNCLYEVVSTDLDNCNCVVAIHKTPAKRYIDDLTFTFSYMDGKCHVDAFSTSRTWYAVLDMGTNYCNLRNLMDGIGYTSANLVETTSDSVCTQYTSRDCARF